MGYVLKRVAETMWVSDLYQGRVVCGEVSQSNVKWREHHASRMLAYSHAWSDRGKFFVSK